ncbi:MAG: hypothetical protein ACXVRX_00380 [Solirubrobacteraceae bacterium]
MYHVELRQFPHVARVFNLSREELESRFLRPWVGGAIIEHDERRWAPERSRLRILEGPELRSEELGMGRGWAAATRSSADVTEAIIAQARRGAQARPELEALKGAIAEVAATPLGFQDVMALAAAAHPHWRASQQLELAEQAVWEMLHQGRLDVSVNGSTVRRERWQPIVLSWATWAGVTTEPFRLHAPVARERPA